MWKDFLQDTVMLKDFLTKTKSTGIQTQNEKKKMEPHTKNSVQQRKLKVKKQATEWEKTVCRL